MVTNKGKKTFFMPSVKPFTLLFELAVFTIIAFMSVTPVYVVMLTVSFVNLLAINKLKAVHYATAFSILLPIFYLLSMSGFYNLWVGSIFTMLGIILKLYPLWMLAAALSSVSANEIMSALRYLHIPNKLAVSTAVFFRFLPDFVYYLHNVKESLKLRGFSFRLSKPLESIELYIVPLIYKSFDTAEVITISLVTKGIEYDCKKTSFKDLSPQVIDKASMALSLILLGISIWIKF